MATVRVLSWNGIPAQVKAQGDTGRPVSVMLPSWFGQEIDRIAMRDGLIDSDAYLAAWEWSDHGMRYGEATVVAYEVAAELAAAWGHPPTEVDGPSGRPAPTDD